MKTLVRLILSFGFLVLFCGFALLCQWYLPHAPGWMQQKDHGEVICYSFGPCLTIFAINMGLLALVITMFVATDDLK
jgi:hypothetical protein